MNPDKEPRPGTREPKARADDRDDSSKITPAADLQADDAISPGLSGELGADGTPASPEPTRASRASKQQGKTDAGR